MQQSKLDTFQEVGIDYITATSRNPSSNASLYTFGAHLVREAVSGGAKRTPSRANGYAGAHADCASYGRRGDGCIIRLSSGTAAEHWFQVTDLADNVSRIDLQATVRVSEGPYVRLRGLWACRGFKPTVKGRRRALKAIMSERGIETLMLGSRSSDVFGRIYNKEVESGETQYAGCVRYELELKSEVACSYALQLAATRNPERRIVATLDKFVTDCIGQEAPGRQSFAAWLNCQDVSHMLSESVPDYLSRPRSGEPNRTASKSLKFLSHCVSPTVRRLIDAGFENEVLHALGLSDYQKQFGSSSNVLDSNKIGGWTN